MSTKGNNWALSVRGVGPVKKAILFALGERCNKDNDCCFPNQKLLAEDAEMSVRALQGHLDELCRMGLLKREVKSPKGRGRLTFYYPQFHQLRPVEGWEDQSAESAFGSEDPSAESDMTQTQLDALSENPNLEPESSEAKASGEDADLFPDSKPKPVASSRPPADPYKQLVFSAGLALLTAQGHTERAARTFLGKLLKAVKDDASIVANCITAAEKAKPADVAGWLRAAIKKRTPGTVEHAADAEDQRAAELDERFARYSKGQRWPTHWGPAPDDPAAAYPVALYAKHGLKAWEAGA